MAFREVALPAGTPGRLLLDAMPGRFESWPAFTQRAQRERLAVVACLTPRDELEELSPAYHAAVGGGRLAFRWTHVPMRNFGTPDDAAAFRRAIGELAQALQAGETVLLHCAAGIGRTGSAAACVLKALGLDAQEALQRVRAAGSNPQNAQQAGFVEWF